VDTINLNSELKGGFAGRQSAVIGALKLNLAWIFPSEVQVREVRLLFFRNPIFGLLHKPKNRS
jgi:hypothetical protein